MSAKYIPKTKAVTITTAGSREAVFSSKKLVASIIIETVNGNSGNVYVGGSDVDSSNGIALKPEKSLDMELQPDANGKLMEIDGSQIWLDADTDGNSVRVLWLERA